MEDNFDHILLFKPQTRDYIINWNEEKVKDMVNGLNNGSITFELSPLDAKGIKFKMRLPQDFNLKINNKMIE
jgi:hypothetical protein